MPIFSELSRLGQIVRLSVPVLTTILALVSTRAVALDYSLNPVADAFVTTGPGGTLSGSNYGGAGSLGVSATNLSKGEFQSVMMFDFSSARTNFDTQFGSGQWAVSAVRLQFTAASPGNPIFNASAAGQFAVSLMKNTNWTEGSGSPASPGATGITFTGLSSLISSNDESLGTFSFSGATSGNFTNAWTLSPSLVAAVETGNLASVRFLAADSTISFIFNARSFGTVSARPVLVISAVARPALTMQVTGENVAKIFWPTSSLPFSLQTATTLSASNWVTSTNDVSLVGSQNETTVSLSGTNQFYRLSYP